MTTKNRWRLVYTVITVGHLLIPLFPIAWLLSGFGKWKIKWLYPFWLTLDDTRKQEDGSLSEDYRIYLRSYWKPIGVFLWHMKRNKMWNLIESFPVPKRKLEKGNQDIVITKLISDDLHYINGKKLIQDGPYAIGAGLKYVGEAGDSPWQVNRGDIISKDHSIIGEGEMEYLDGDFKGWRKTSCKLVRPWYLFGAERWKTVYFGTNSNRYAFKWKHQKDKPLGEWS